MFCFSVKGTILVFVIKFFSNLHFERFLAKASASTCFDGNDEDERLADNECYANGNPAGPFLPSKQGEQITIQNNTKQSQL